MSSDRTVTRETLARWPLPDGGDSKYSRGTVLVVGGAVRSPGAAMLAGIASLRVGAGRLTLAVGSSVATAVAVAVPECGVVPLPERDGHVLGKGLAEAAEDLGSADAVLVGPGLDHVEETAALVRGLDGLLGDDATLVLDAFALGALATDPALRDGLPARLILTPNRDEAELLLGRPLADDPAPDIAELAERFRATITCYGDLAGDGEAWTVGRGGPGLGTSGSGDVLAGAITGFAARGLPPVGAAAWGTWVHAAAGDALAERLAPLGYLARDLLPELTPLLRERG
jgi:ADP-dependent NAD(P)H-hydrate dehydratase